MSEELYASPLLRWPGAISELEPKQALAARVADRLEDGQRIGVGSGPGGYLVLVAIARRAAEHRLSVTVVCSGYEAATAALGLGLQLGELGTVEPDWAVDHADEVDPEGRVLKSRGGGLAMDRLLWRTAQRMYLAVDSSQFVGALGRKLPLPVEVHRDAVIPVARELTRLGAGDVQLRLSAGKDGPVITESGNLLLDARFSSLAPGLAAAITALPGAIETGLFEGCGFETLS